jgi:nitrite reductase/ring-hydroxylating ferredoxin subunit
MQSLLSRRDIIKTLFVTSACSIINNNLWAAKVVSEVTANFVPPPLGIARIQLSAFTALNSNGGSVRLGASGLNGMFSAGAFQPIIINRVSAAEYVVVTSACLHEGAVISRLTIPVGQPITAGRMTCPNHQAQYEIRGICTRNPSSGPNLLGQSLQSFRNSLNNGILTIELPEQGFSFTQNTVVSAGEKRLALTWDALEFVDYEVRYRPDFATEPVRVNCAMAANDPLTVGVIAGIRDGATRTVYVQALDGFFQIAVALRMI